MTVKCGVRRSEAMYGVEERRDEGHQCERCQGDGHRDEGRQDEGRQGERPQGEEPRVEEHLGKTA